jgi:hypothetical protein
MYENFKLIITSHIWRGKGIHKETLSKDVILIVACIIMRKWVEKENAQLVSRPSFEELQVRTTDLSSHLHSQCVAYLSFLLSKITFFHYIILHISLPTKVSHISVFPKLYS